MKIFGLLFLSLAFSAAAFADGNGVERGQVPIGSASDVLVPDWIATAAMSTIHSHCTLASGFSLKPASLVSCSASNPDGLSNFEVVYTVLDAGNNPTGSITLEVNLFQATPAALISSSSGVTCQ